MSEESSSGSNSPPSCSSLVNHCSDTLYGPHTPPHNHQRDECIHQYIVSPVNHKVPANSPASVDFEREDSPVDPMTQGQILRPIGSWHPSHPQYNRHASSSASSWGPSFPGGDAADDDNNDHSDSHNDKASDNGSSDSEDHINDKDSKSAGHQEEGISNISEDQNDGGVKLPNSDDDSDSDVMVEEEYLQPVVQEVVKPTEHDVEHRAVDRDLFDDEYHTTVQTIKDRQVDEDIIMHRVATLKQLTQDDRDDAVIREHLAKEASEFHDEHIVDETIHTHSVAPEVVTEHHHHHMHERVQPVIQREILQRTVVHTTRPVHETHHLAPRFARPTVLPPITMEEFLRGGGRVRRQVGGGDDDKTELKAADLPPTDKPSA